MRMAILDVLQEREVATATECASVVDASVQACAYHLRTLANWGLVEQVWGPDGRERRWRLRVPGFNVPKLRTGSPQFEAAWATLRGRIVERDIDLVRRFVEADDAFRPEQQEASTVRNMTLYGTPEELQRLADEVSSLLARYRRRPHERPERSERVHAVFWLIPRQDSPRRPSTGDRTDGS
jgi:predicted ArsR family transcriptional regulator